MLSSRAEGGKEERRRKKKKRGERGAFFFPLLAQIMKVFVSFVHQSSPALARAMNSERVVAKSFYHHRQHDAMKSRPFALALSLTLFLSSLNNLHSLLLKNENIFERVFSMCKIKNLPLCPRKKEISLGSNHSPEKFFFSNQRTPASTSCCEIFAVFFISSPILFSSSSSSSNGERVGKRTHRAHPRALRRYASREDKKNERVWFLYLDTKIKNTRSSPRERKRVFCFFKIARA